jgi:four helix bundle protein
MTNQSVKFKTQDKTEEGGNNLRHRCYYFSVSLIRFLGTLPEKRVFWTIGDQLLRSGTSVGANVVEASAASSRKDFTRYYEIALKSANESKYWLCLLRDTTATPKDSIAPTI